MHESVCGLNAEYLLLELKLARRGVRVGLAGLIRNSDAYLLLQETAYRPEIYRESRLTRLLSLL
jgi:hypothetical protein